MVQSIIDDARWRSARLGSDEIARYARHLVMPEVTMEGQRKLKAASVLCVGMGGLGSPVVLYLAAAGVGRIGLVDHDVVDFSNLQRQILHATADVGRKKLNSARETIRALNPNVQVELHHGVFEAGNAMEIASSYDLLVDGSDNFPTRYLCSDVGVFLGKPNVYGSVFRFDGQATVFAPHLGAPCYRCLFPEPPPAGSVPTCAEGGVLGVLPGMVGVIQAIEVVKLVVGVGEPLLGRLLKCEALAMRFREIRVQRDPECPVCGVSPSIQAPINYGAFCGVPQERTGGGGSREALPSLAPGVLKSRLDRGEPIRLIDIREPHEWDICHLAGARLIPPGEFHERVSELDSAEDIVLYCKDGGRSAAALRILMDAGFARAANLEGGLDAWAEQVDSGFPRY